MARLTKQGRGAPAATDYIVYARDIRMAAMVTGTVPVIESGYQ